MADSAELALKEASDSGAFLGGKVLVPVRGDSTCIDAAAATAAAERLVTAEGVAAIFGADCSGVTIAITNNVSVPNGVVTISPSATSPALTTIEDNGLFFRTAPSDARQGQVLAELLIERGIDSVAVTYTNNDYGKGLDGSFGENFTALGGTVEISAAHEDGKGDYSAEVGALAASGAEHLVVFGYVDQGGKGIIQTSVDTGAFENFIVADGMIGDSLIEAIGDALTGTVGTAPGSASEGAQMFLDHAAANGIDGNGPFRGESYDAAALIVLAMQAAGSADRGGIAAHVMAVANGPGEPILPGELAKGSADSRRRRRGRLCGRVRRRAHRRGRGRRLLRGDGSRGRRLRDQGNPLERVRLGRTRDRPRQRPAANAAPSRRRRPKAGCRERQRHRAFPSQTDTL